MPAAKPNSNSNIHFEQINILQLFILSAKLIAISS